MYEDLRAPFLNLFNLFAPNKGSRLSGCVVHPGNSVSLQEIIHEGQGDFTSISKGSVTGMPAGLTHCTHEFHVSLNWQYLYVSVLLKS